MSLKAVPEEKENIEVVVMDNPGEFEFTESYTTDTLSHHLPTTPSANDPHPRSASVQSATT